MIRRLLLIIAALVFFSSECCLSQSIREVFTSTRSITGIVVAPDGTVAASTHGGMLVLSGGVWRKYTMLDGLSTNEILGVFLQDSRIVALSTMGCHRLFNNRWTADNNLKPPEPIVDGQLCAVRYKGMDCVATAEGLQIRTGNDSWKTVGMPPSTGTHISALLDKGDVLWAALYGDGLFTWNGKTWSRVKLDLPKCAREITAMIAAGKQLWIGTSREGIWEYDGSRWKQHLQPNEPWDHNCQALAWHKGKLYVSTLDEGLMVYDQNGWKHVRVPEISGHTPRQMVELGGRLYLRHSTGTVDRFDGKTWTKNVMSNLPRKQCSAIATDQEKLYIGQWGGWSEFDEKTLTHHFGIAELQGCQVTALLPEGTTLWMGTQGRGLVEIDRYSGQVIWHDERVGMPDDTVKCIARCGETLYVGTFSQGVAYLDNNTGRWRQIEETAASQVTAIAADGFGGLYLGTRTCLWHINAAKQVRPIIRGLEVQALLVIGEDIWIGARTGLLRVSQVSGAEK